MKEKVQEVLNRIRPTLQADGGNIELVDIVDGDGNGFGILQLAVTDGECHRIGSGLV